ncbi:ammonium transporter 2 [Quercus suber]|uniref:Ammonium transporter 2 n=1 Tax=Quercus suber TaxID=58331 RepID=A0AAW0IUZ5_QUESU
MGRELGLYGPLRLCGRACMLDGLGLSNASNFIGRPNVALDEKFLLDKTFSGHSPNATMVYFQFVFAAIILNLIAGALLGRMNFYAWMLFLPLWLTFSYTICAFSIWSPNGWLTKMGIIDYSGGFVIHISSGWLVSLQLIEGWFTLDGMDGFNGGDPYTVSVEASLAVLNTHVCTATSLLTWLLLDILFFGKPSVIGATQGHDHWFSLHHPSCSTSTLYFSFFRHSHSTVAW